MNYHYKDYFWEKGLPQGREQIPEPEKAPRTIKIITDPYRKHYSIEEYRKGKFHAVLYDSRFLDFRNLKPVDQTAWQKEVLWEKDDSSACIIRNLEDRVIYKEVYQFENQLCKECKTYSPHDLLLSVQKMYYTRLKDPMDGVVLFDAHAHPVMLKRYETDENGEFTNVLEENWKVPLNLGIYAKNSIQRS